MEIEMKQKQAIAMRLALARKQAGLSQGQVAKLLDLHRPTISELEAARRNVTGPELAKFAEIYGVSIDWLAGTGVDEPDVNRDRIHLAARELAKMAPDDLSKVLDLLSALRGPDQKNE
ncbi:MAG: helix-turn-helix transcriptional regulator [Opitutales bacterium]